LITPLLALTLSIRPSKFPLVEALMATWLQECLDRDVPITDSSIRQKALEAANHSGVPREKFKASSGWIENFKHRHEIRGGKWTAGIKNAPVVDNNENPGLYGGPKDTVISFNRQPIAGDSSDSSMQSSRHASPEPDSPTDGANGDHSYRRSREASERGQESSSWHSSSYRGIPSLVDRNLPSPLYGSSREPVDDDSQSPTGDGSNGEVQTLLYLPPAYPSAHHQVDDYSKLPGQRGPPTIHDAEQAVEVLMTFLDNAPEKLIPRVITLEERDVLRHIKTQLCRITLGMPLASRKNS
jgi:Tc5 transposase DNA-binding domain